MWAQLLRLGDVQAVGPEGDEDVGFDAGFALMVDRANRQIAFEIFERLFDAVSAAGNSATVPPDRCR
jgi:hypothetical protein